MSLEFLMRVLLIKRNFTLLSKALGNERSPTFPKTGPPWKWMPISSCSLLLIVFKNVFTFDIIFQCLSKICDFVPSLN